jgi:hypothetical protein
MSIYVNNSFRIKRSASQQELMQKMIQAKIFSQYKDILMISAIIGYLNNRFIPIEKAASDGVLMQFFNEKDYNIIDLIAYARKKEQNIITSDEKYEIFSTYANGGFPILVKQLGINENQEINTDEAKKIIIKYYTLLLSKGFIDKDLDSNFIYIKEVA